MEQYDTDCQASEWPDEDHHTFWSSKAASRFIFGELPHDECRYVEPELQFVEGPREQSEYMLNLAAAMVRIQRLVLDFIKPSLTAVIDDDQIEFSGVQDKFLMLAHVWDDYNLGRSRTEYNHFAHYQIIGMGMTIVPLLLRKVKEGDNKWLTALKAITGANPDRHEELGNAESVRSCWIRWGIEQGYGIYTGQAFRGEEGPSHELDNNRSQRRRLE